MSGFLTPAATMTCPHGGTVQAIPASSNLTAGGAPVLAATDTFIVAGCPFVVGVVPSPCIMVQWVQPATRSTRSGAPTLTAASVGLCIGATGAPQGPVIITPGQTQATGQ
jgi:hypothetical protein